MELYEALITLQRRLFYRRCIGGGYISKDLAKRLEDLVEDLIESLSKSPKSTLEEIEAELEGCTRCPLHRFRRNIVPGEGNPGAEVVFVGEGPGEQEDLLGRPFVGPAGTLLTRMITAMGLSREEVFICNVVKCRPPGNRTPRPDEIESCLPFLLRQLSAISPRVICALGTVAAQALLRTDERISRLRGRFHRWEGAVLMPTYHPSYLLKNPHMKREVWEDLKQVMDFLGLKSKGKGG